MASPKKAILQHPVANQETKDLAGRLQKELETKLSFQAVEAVHRCAAEKDLNELICQLTVIDKLKM